MSESQLEITTFLIIGGGIAGVSCAEGLSLLKPDDKCILISSSPLLKAATNVMHLSKTIVKFDVEEKPVQSYNDLFPSLSVIHDTVINIDYDNRTVTTLGGRHVQFKKLCICTGGYPKLLVQDNPYVIGIRDTESVKEFETRIKNARKILVVGNGGIATEIVHELEGLEIVWAIKDKHISAPFIDPGAAQFFQAQVQKTADKQEKPKMVIKRLKYNESGGSTIETSGFGAALGPDWHSNIGIAKTRTEKSKVVIEYECEIKSIWKSEKKDDEWPVYAELTNGKIYGCDVIVSAIGVHPNSDFLNNKVSLADDGGIIVDWKLETSIPDVFAAGDVCTASWEHAMHWFQMRLWTQARQMGTYAAKAMASTLDKEEFYQDFCFELFSHVTHFFGFKVVLLGLYNGQKLNNDYELILRVTSGVEYIKLVMKDGKLQGAVLVGETDLEEMCENLILDQLDLKDFGAELLNPDVDIDDYFD